MAAFKFLLASVVVVASFLGAHAESHTVMFDNRCGFGTPILRENGQTLSTGGSFTSNGPLVGAIAFLQTGSCGDNGEGCTVIEITLRNPTSPGNGSSTDISLIPPHAFSVTSGFGYFNGCDGVGEDCTSANCAPAFQNPIDNPLQATCQDDNVNIVITFCD